MKISTKAALLSALIFPGCGHWILKRYLMAFLLAGISMACIGWIVLTALQVAQGIADQIVNGQIPLNAADIVAAITREEAVADTRQSSTLATYLIIACWAVGIVDAFRVGRHQEKDAQ